MNGPSCPVRAVRPHRCRCISAVAAGVYWITWCRLGKSMPRAARSVHTSTGRSPLKNSSMATPRSAVRPWKDMHVKPLSLRCSTVASASTGSLTNTTALYCASSFSAASSAALRASSPRTSFTRCSSLGWTPPKREVLTQRSESAPLKEAMMGPSSRIVAAAKQNCTLAPKRFTPSSLMPAWYAASMTADTSISKPRLSISSASSTTTWRRRPGMTQPSRISPRSRAGVATSTSARRNSGMTSMSPISWDPLPPARME
mmetsp:Transcript_8168/g.20647  ORF Transcript_8168/g.20647 Transcript_8168/m.20647 type:complete len:258 (-) Transcript_8168:1042-1815(-)